MHEYTHTDEHVYTNNSVNERGEKTSTVNHELIYI